MANRANIRTLKPLRGHALDWQGWRDSNPPTTDFGVGRPPASLRPPVHWPASRTVVRRPPVTSAVATVSAAADRRAGLTRGRNIRARVPVAASDSATRLLVAICSRCNLAIAARRSPWATMTLRLERLTCRLPDSSQAMHRAVMGLTSDLHTPQDPAGVRRVRRAPTPTD